MLRTLVVGLAVGGVYGLLAVGLVLVYKGSRVLNFAQGELGTFGLYIAWMFVNDERRLPWWVGALFSILAVTAIGLLFERLVVRRMAESSRLSVAVATIGLLLFLVALEFRIFGSSPRIVDPPIQGLGPKIFNFYVSPTYIIALMTVAALGVALTAFFNKTDFGLGVLAAAQDPTAVRLVGVPLHRVSAFTWGVASAVSAVAALLIEPTRGSFSPLFMSGIFVFGLAGALLGGLNSLQGAFVGGVAMGVVQKVVEDLFSTVRFPGVPEVAVFLVIIAVLIFRPQGLMARAR